MPLSLVRWLVYALAIAVAAYVLPGIHVASTASLLVLAIVLGGLNMFIRPILVILTLPLTVMTLGLFALVINAALVMFAGFVVPGFTVDGFLWAVAFSIVLSIVRGFFGVK